MDTKLKGEEHKDENYSIIKSDWISVTARIRRNKQDLFSTQLKRLHCDTLNQLAKEVIAGKITTITEDKQIENNEDASTGKWNTHSTIRLL
jgi:hypothetical protein